MSSFPPAKPITPGIEPIIGQATPRNTGGLNPNNQNESFAVPQFVFPKGGGYFFVPSIPALNSSVFTS